MAPSLTAYQDKINSSQNILIVYGRQAHFGAVAVATCVYLWLRALHKRVTIVSAAPATVDLSHLVGINKVKTSSKAKISSSDCLCLPAKLTKWFPTSITKPTA